MRQTFKAETDTQVMLPVVLTRSQSRVCTSLYQLVFRAQNCDQYGRQCDETFHFVD